MTVPGVRNVPHVPPVSHVPGARDGAGERLEHAHLLVTLLPCFVDESGTLWLDRLWHRDFAAHFTYLRNITLAAPQLPKSDVYRGNMTDLVRVDVPDGCALQLVALPEQTSLRAGMQTLPAVVRALWKSVQDADVVHANIVGWPYPLGWVANPIAILQRKQLFIVVESAPWRLTGSADDTWRRRARAGITERLARFFVNHADLALFTQPAYRDSLMTNGRGKAVVLPASWVEEKDILSDEDAFRAWQRKGARERPRFLFAGRMTADKGVSLLLHAVVRAEQNGCDVDIDLIGEGPLRDACAAAAAARAPAAQARKHVSLRLLDPIAYGAPFLTLLRDYDAVLVPSLGDEQPRIVFDAFSQAVPVVASNTEGLVAYVHDDDTGLIFPRGDVAALAALLTRAANHRAQLARCGMVALAKAREMTLSVHHDRRRDALREMVSSSSSRKSARRA